MSDSDVATLMPVAKTLTRGFRVLVFIFADESLSFRIHHILSRLPFRFCATRGLVLKKPLGFKRRNNVGAFARVAKRA